MQEKNFFKAAVFALVIVIISVAGWELFWRNKGYVPTFNDDKALWANKRKDVYQPQNEATVFIGSSRIKFDLDIPTWRKITGEDAVQLSLVGTSPILLLEDLANDEDFRGKLMIDVTEVLFFGTIPPVHESAKEATEYYRKQTPSEKVSSKLNFALESRFAFLEERRFALRQLLEDLEIPSRKGVFVVPPFPKGFEWTTYDRQTYMSDLFLKDTNEINRQTSIWNILIMGNPVPAVDGADLDKMLADVKTNIDKIKARGGKVIFVRTPSSGPMAIGEAKKYPRTKYWDRLLEFTGVDGIHFQDYPETKNYVCPEWSHLDLKDAVHYTESLVRTLQSKNWFDHALPAPSTTKL